MYSPTSRLLAALLLGAGCTQGRSWEAPAVPAPVAARAAAGPSADWSVEIQAGIATGEYAPRFEGGLAHVTNRQNDLRGTFGERGLALATRNGNGQVTLSLRAWGREGKLLPAGASTPAPGACVAGGAVDALGECLHQVVYARPGLVEWWENRPEGLEQGFTVDVRPVGNGRLVFDLAITGAIIEAGRDGILLRREGAEALRFAGLTARDSAGRALPAWMEAADSGVRLAVDDAGAIGAVTVDPLLTTEAWSAEGDQEWALLGWSVASAGDVNRDGYGDLVVGAPEFDHGSAGRGRAYVYLGSASGPATTASWVAETDDASVLFGYSVAAAGDVNADGYADLAVGVIGYYESGEPGSALVYLGSSLGLSSSPDWEVESDQGCEQFGNPVSSAGDVNGDGFADLAVGAWFYDTGDSPAGQALVYLGSATGPSTTAAWTAESDQASPNFGGSVASAGDVNGDGYGDVVVGSPFEGRAYVYLGSSSGLGATADAKPEDAGTAFGYSVSSAGDVNGDGYSDVVVGEAWFDYGSAFTFLGSSAGLSTVASWVAESDQAGANFGWSVASAGDVNGDGFGDVVVGAPDYRMDGLSAGRAYVYLGSASGLWASASWTESGVRGSFGYSVAPAGDVDGDGYDDILVGDPYYSNDDGFVGAARVYLGTDYCGGVDGLVDADGDGYACDDCDDAVAEINPDAEERCDGIDNDCDGTIDVGGVDGETWYADLDADGYVYPWDTVTDCAPPAGYGNLHGDEYDCDDTRADVNPGAPEVCDDADTDEDCDSLADDEDPSASGQAMPFADQDGDGYGGVAGLFCDGATTSTDCDDDDRGVHPGAAEACNFVDDDCDGEVDEDLPTFTWYPDGDEDGYTDPDDPVFECGPPPGYAAESDTPDCDDSDPAVGAGSAAWYPDRDADGYSGEDPFETTPTCQPPPGYSALTDPPDCDDADPTTFPGAGDPPGDDIDQNCNGRDTPGSGCGCSAVPAPLSTLPVGLIVLALVAKRRRPRPPRRRPTSPPALAANGTSPCSVPQFRNIGRPRPAEAELGRAPLPSMPPPRSTPQSSSLNTAKNASCGTSTLPICFMRFLPSFCRSSSLRLRLMSPP